MVMSPQEDEFSTNLVMLYFTLRILFIVIEVYILIMFTSSSIFFS